VGRGLPNLIINIKCRQNHTLLMTSAGDSWSCDHCATDYGYNPRLRCVACNFDVCSMCETKKAEAQPSQQQQEEEEEERRIQHQKLPFKSEWDEMMRQAQLGVKSLGVDARQINGAPPRASESECAKSQPAVTRRFTFM